MPGLFAKKTEDASATKLALVWQTLDPVVKGYFEKLYEAVPDKVAEVLNGSPLPRDEGHPTLESWVKTVQEENGSHPDGLTLLKVRPHVQTVKVEPQHPAAGEAFTASWEVLLETDFPARQDRVEVLDMNKDARPVFQQILSSPEAAKGSSAGELKIDGLPTGRYLVQVWANIEGGAGDTPNDHGLSGIGGVEILVGESEDSQVAHDAPLFQEALSAIQALALHPQPDKAAADQLAKAFTALSKMDRFGEVLVARLQRVSQHLGRDDALTLKEGKVWEAVRDDFVRSGQSAGLETAASWADDMADQVDEGFVAW